jgi:hypothetical protein
MHLWTLLLSLLPTADHLPEMLLHLLHCLVLMCTQSSSQELWDRGC